MRQQWNEMARCNPFFSITSWPDFENMESLNLDFFWEIGRVHGHNLLAYLPLSDTSQMTMVEIGCGLGRMTHYFSKQFKRIYALDISEEMIRHAKTYWNKLANVTFSTGNGKDLQPITDKSVDFVFSFYVLNHAVEPGVVLHYIRETARVLKPGGLALLHFRIPRDYPLWRKSLFQRGLLALHGIKPKNINALWWNEGIERVMREYKTSLPIDFIRFESWQGCEVPWESVLQVSRESGLKIINTDSTLAANTQFVFVTLRRK